MGKRALIVHLNAMPNVTPLVGGYLKAAAQADPVVRAEWEIELHSSHLSTSASGVLQQVVDRPPDVVAFSVYVWNAGLVTRLLPALQGLLPRETQFLLGGVEVMHQAARFVRGSWENVAVCNGEGEGAFRDYLLQVGDSRPRLESVAGLSFFRDGEWITNEPRPRIRTLDEIPSPWLSDAIDLDGVEVALFETNRGCPYACEFCYWGGAIGQKISRSTMDRLKSEIEYLARRRVGTLTIVDANFGILQDDLEIADHVIRMRETYGAPYAVKFSAAKNHPDRVEEIAKRFFDSGLLTVQTISLQSMDERTLETAKRQNIKIGAYLQLQKRLNELGTPSCVEMIWPLPGETLDSFKDGVNELCARGAQAFTVYPLLLLNNIGYEEKRDALGLVTLDEEDPAGTAEIVIQTNEATFEDYRAGLQFATGLYVLHDCRGLYATLQILNALGLGSFRTVIDAFVRWMASSARAPRSLVGDIWDGGVRHFEQMYKYAWRGALSNAVLHRDRAQLDELLRAFAADHDYWTADAPEHAELVRAAVDFDLLSRPYLFLQTDPGGTDALLELVVTEKKRAGWVLESPYDFPAIVAESRRGAGVSAATLSRGRFEISIDHRRGLVYLRPGRSDEEMNWQCYEVSRAIGNIEPKYSTCALEGFTTVAAPRS